LLKWIREHRAITCFTLAAILLIAVLVTSYGRHEVPSYALTIQAAVAELQKPVTELAKILDRGTRGVFDFRSLVDENQSLGDRIAELEAEVLDLQMSQAELEELKKLSEALNYTGVQDSKLKIAASVISMDGSTHFNIFTLDAGIRSGVVKDAVVVNGHGLIGRVMEVGPRFGKVVSVTDTNNNVSFRIYRSETESYLGIASGDGQGGLSGYMLDADANVQAGDQLITSGIGLYPAGLALGTVSAVSENKDVLLKTITIETAVDFSNLSKVLVIVTKDNY
jgi:rod shape-determining protein MreC